MIFVDTNVVLDIVQNDPRWGDWSAHQLQEALTDHPVVVNAVVVAELGRDFVNAAALTGRLATLDLVIEPLDEHAAFLAGKRFVAARRSRAAGERSRPLPDFFIGAHALSLDATLLTRDAAIYRRHFADLPLITPETHP